MPTIYVPPSTLTPAKIDSPGTFFSRIETINKTTAPQVGNNLEIHVPADMTERRIYAYLETVQSAGGQLRTIVKLLKAGTVVGDYPLEIGDVSSATGPPGLWAILSQTTQSGATPVGDSLVYGLAAPFTVGVNNAIIYPLRLNSVCDKIRLEITQVVGTVTGWRAMIACLSARLA